MKEKSLKIVIGVFLIIIVVLLAMIALKGKNLNPFANEGNDNPIQERQEGTLHESISIPLTEGVQIYDSEGGGSVTIDDGEMTKQEIGE